ncbi:DUF7167 family protein [Endozoicomonas sp. ALC066]|uniref:DUF7167 family protein n=1 Tax=Endozoicomonas sp. ALC066 TaxID=3403078 RepID=UPI003BB603DC
MAKLKVTLSIGYPTATREDLIEVDDDELASCETEEQREDLLMEYWQEWANNLIEGTSDLIEE